MPCLVRGGKPRQTDYIILRYCEGKLRGDWKRDAKGGGLFALAFLVSSLFLVNYLSDWLTG
ncbi:hypothetical protein DL95DRAFT_381219 [Leptodontidium sp. 2 PMI_412]|nr:hypothetical protein DL95DRAFT_381219 [Leptodontidium sp. 2 PMI_412]